MGHPRVPQDDDRRVRPARPTLVRAPHDRRLAEKVKQAMMKRGLRRPSGGLCQLADALVPRTGVLQLLRDFGGLIWEGEPFEPSARARKNPYVAGDLEALRRIFEVNERVGFELVVTEATLRVVEARGHASYTR